MKQVSGFFFTQKLFIMAKDNRPKGKLNALERKAAKAKGQAGRFVDAVESKVKKPRLPASPAQKKLRVLQNQLKKSGDWDKMSKQAQKAWRAAKLIDLNKPVKAVTEAAKTPKTPKAPDNRPLKQKMSDAANKSSKLAEKAALEKAEAAKKLAKKTGTKIAAEGSKAAVQGASKLGSVTGAITGLGKAVAPITKVAGKALVPLAIASEAYDAGKLLTTEGRAEALKRSVDMAEDGALSRAGNSFISPVKTIGGATQIASDAISTSLGNLFTDTSETNTKIEGLQQSKQAQEAALDSGLSREEQKELRAYSRDNKLGKDYGNIRTAEEARGMYDSAFGSDKVVDAALAGATPADDEEPAPEKAPPKAVPVYDDEADEPDEPDETVGDYSEQALGLFKNTHGTGYDPKSSKDRKKLEKMESMLAAQGGLGDMSPNQFALNLYRSQ